MADGGGSAALPGQLAALRHKLIATIDKFEKKAKKRAKADEGSSPSKDVNISHDVNTSHTSFKRPGAVQQSRLLSLPPEIRNMIWKLCLSHPKDIGDEMDLNLRERSPQFTMMTYQSSDQARPKLREAYQYSTAKRTKQSIRSHSFRNLALMQTCQATYIETAPVLWSQRFNFYSTLHLQAFLFSHARLDLVRDICVWLLDLQMGVNFMPAICTLLADKVKNLDHFDVDMSSMHRVRMNRYRYQRAAFQSVEEIRKAGVRLGFDLYSCMHPWVTKVVSEQGIDRLMAILQIHRETGRDEDLEWVGLRIHDAFQGRGPLTDEQQEIADSAFAREILRLVNLYKKDT